MSDDHEFAILARSLGDGDFARRLVAADRLRRYTSMVVAGLGLLAFAVLLALTNTISIVITMAVVLIVLSEVVRLGINEHHRATV
jgi:hypothetical protein